MAEPATAVVDEPAPSGPPEPEPERQTPDPAAELDARFDAARERLRAKIAPPDPDD